IDTEGYDWKVLQQLELDRYQPCFILYEHKHLAVADYTATLQFLQPEYTTFTVGIDTLAVHQRVGSEVINTMAKKMEKAL
ncbi:MAG: hypothetical protein AAFQ37_00490, partial [Bacteroidota bacterium]